MPQLQGLHSSLGDRVDFLGIDTQDARGPARSFVTDNTIDFPILYDQQGETALRLGNIPGKLPFTVLIDQRGRVAAVYFERTRPRTCSARSTPCSRRSDAARRRRFHGDGRDRPAGARGRRRRAGGADRFLSPCVLPLVPGYLSYVAGLSGDDSPTPRRMLAGALLFVLGFTVVLVTQGTLFGEFGFFVRQHEQAIERVFGVITIVMGIVFLGGISFLQREVKIHRLPRAGLVGAPCSAWASAWPGRRA